MALADYCRRAKVPGTPQLIREALALLSESDDFRVRQITDAEVDLGSPLGPFGLVDVAMGTAPALAAARESTGFYELAQALAEARAQSSEVPAAATPSAADRRETPASPSARTQDGAPPDEVTRRTAARTRRQSVQEKIAPKVRSAGEPSPAIELDPPPPATSFLPRRQLPAPRGRFAKVEAAKAPFEALLRPAALDELHSLLEQVNTRVAVKQALEHGYCGRAPAGLSLTEVEQVLDRHGLCDAMRARERGAILSAMTDARGARGRAAHALGLGAHELEHLIEACRIEREVEEIRDRAAREALSPKHLQLRLDLLGRSKYLADLGIEARFGEALANDLEALLDESSDAAASEQELIALIARREAVNAELLLRACNKLGLMSKNEDGNDADL